MALRFLSDRALYTDYKHYRCESDWWRELARDGRRAVGRLIYHCFWTGRLGPLHEVSIKSLLATQSPPLEVWLWLPPGMREANAEFLDILQAEAPAVRVRCYVAEQEAQGTPAEGRIEAIAGSTLALVSDLFRALVLARYGGIYFDLDMLFLADLRPLCGAEFCYAWSNRPYGNSAILRFHPESPNAHAVIRRGVALQTFHPKHLYTYRDLGCFVDGLYVLPSFVFDPAWIAHDTRTPINTYCNRFDDFFDVEEPMPMRAFFSGSYCYHWHNRWDHALKPRSIAGQLYREICRRGSGHTVSHHAKSAASGNWRTD